MTPSNVLVLGSNSFSGLSTTKLLLRKGFFVVGISRTNKLPLCYRPFDQDNVNYKTYALGSNPDPSTIVEICKKEKVDQIINFAAQSMVAESWNNPEDWYTTNCVWLSSLVLSLIQWGGVKKFVNFSTPEVYGSTNEWTTENFTFNPTTPYAISRAAGDLHLRAVHIAEGFPVLFVRTANIYGPCQPRHRIIPTAILASLAGGKFPMHGGGLSRRSFVFCDDVAEAVYRILLKGKFGETYHVSGEESITILDLVRLIFELQGLDAANFFELTDDRKGKDGAYLLSSAKIRKELGWADSVTLQEGLERTINWALANESELRLVPSEYFHRR